MPALPGESYFGSDVFTRGCAADAAAAPAWRGSSGASPAPRPGCPLATGRLSGTTLGLVRLGFTRARARRAYTHSSDRGRRYEDFFCLTPTGVRVGYASAKLLSLLSRSPARAGPRPGGVGLDLEPLLLAARHPARRVAGRGPPGSPARRAVPRRPQPWYFAPNGPSTALLKVRRGIVQEIGIADKALTGRRGAKRAFVTSFS